MKCKYWCCLAMKPGLRFAQKRPLLLCIGIVTLLIYYAYNRIKLPNEEIFVKTRKLDYCLGRISKSITQLVIEYNALEYTIHNQLTARTFLPYIGNGYFGATNVGQNRLFLQHNGHLGAPIALDLLIDFTIRDFHSVEKIALNFIDGTIHKFGCYRQPDADSIGGQESVCVSARYTALAHRTIPQLLLQELILSNPTSKSVRVQLLRRSSAPGKGSRRKLLSVNGKSDYSLTTQWHRMPNGKRAVLSVAEPVIGEFVTVESGGAKQIRLLTFLSVASVDSKVVGDALDRIHAESGRRADRLLKLDFADLLAEHKGAWRGLWQRGFSIAKSLAPNALNGDSVNCTLYYLMSQKPINTRSHLLLKRNISQSIQQKPLHRYDRCFSGHDLFQIRHMWRRPLNAAELNSLIEQWLLTLSKFGCSHLIEAGARGITQAVLLAIGEFSFSGNHLEFNMHSSQLVRDMTFRSIAYGANATLSVTVEVDDSNKALLFVSVSSAKIFYACGAACFRRTPVKLDGAKTQLPLRITTPRTPLLYVSSDSAHIRSLYRVIHVLDVRDAPAHEHHVIAMHRHGHPLGGLPAVFWAGLGLLLLVFHMFLFKLVYSEVCKGEPVIQPYSKHAYG